MVKKHGWTSSEGGDELKEQGQRLIDAIEAEALLLSHKDGAPLIEASHVKKAVKKVMLKDSRIAMRVIIALSLSMLLPIAFYQMGTIYPSNAVNLWILPLFSLAWVVIVVILLKDGL